MMKKIRRRVNYEGLEALAAETGYHRTYLSGVAHGHRKSAPVALLLWQRCGIKSKNQNVKYE